MEDGGLGRGLRVAGYIRILKWLAYKELNTGHRPTPPSIPSQDTQTALSEHDGDTARKKWTAPRASPIP